MSETPRGFAACDVAVMPQDGTPPAWQAEGTCGWTGSHWPRNAMGRDDATREGARHLYVTHGIYAGGHKPTMAAMEADDV